MRPAGFIATEKAMMSEFEGKWNGKSLVGLRAVSLIK